MRKNAMILPWCKSTNRRSSCVTMTTAAFCVRSWFPSIARLFVAIHNIKQNNTWTLGNWRYGFFSGLGTCSFLKVPFSLVSVFCLTYSLKNASSIAEKRKENSLSRSPESSNSNTTTRCLTTFTVQQLCMGLRGVGSITDTSSSESEVPLVY